MRNEAEDENAYEALVEKKDGRTAWLVCLGGFIVQVLIVGVLHVWGVFFLHLIDGLRATKAQIAWAGSGAYGLSMAFGPITGILVKKYGCRRVVFGGCVVCSVSLLLTSFITKIGMIYASFTVLYGVGVSLAYTPTMTIAQDYFDKYISVATGIMTAGSSTGTLVLSPISNILIKAVGWRNTMRVFSSTCFLSAFCALLFKPVKKPSRERDEDEPSLPPRSLARNIIEELSIWNNRVFVVWSLALTLAMFGYYIPYVHLVAYAKDVGVPENKGSMLMMVLGGSTAIGRVIFGKIVVFSCLDRLHMHQLSMIVTGTAAMMLPTITTFNGLIVYVILVGLVDGCFVVLMPLMTATFVGNDKAVMAWGFVTGACSITFMIGPPAAGWLYASTGSYNVAFHVAGVPLFAGAIVLLFIPWAIRTSTTTSALSSTSLHQAEPFVDEELLFRLSMAAADIFEDVPIKSQFDSSGTAASSICPPDSGKPSMHTIQPSFGPPRIGSQTSTSESGTSYPTPHSSICISRIRRASDSEQYARKFACYQKIVEQYKRVMSSRRRNRYGQYESSSLLTGSRRTAATSTKTLIPSSKSDYDTKTTRSLEQVSQQLRLTHTSSWLLGGYKSSKDSTSIAESRAASPDLSKAASIDYSLNENPSATEAANVKQAVDERMEATIQNAETADVATTPADATEITEPTISMFEQDKSVIQTTDDRVTIVPDVDLTKLPNIDPKKVLTLVVDCGNIDGNIVDPDKLVGIDLSRVMGLERSVGVDQKPVSGEIQFPEDNLSETEVVDENTKKLGKIITLIPAETICELQDSIASTSNVPSTEEGSDQQHILLVPIVPKQCPSPVELCTGKKYVRFHEVREGLIPITEDSDEQIADDTTI